MNQTLCLTFTEGRSRTVEKLENGGQATAMLLACELNPESRLTVIYADMGYLRGIIGQVIKMHDGKSTIYYVVAQGEPSQNEAVKQAEAVIDSLKK